MNGVSKHGIACKSELECQRENYSYFRTPLRDYRQEGSDVKCEIRSDYLTRHKDRHNLGGLGGF